MAVIVTTKQNVETILLVQCMEPVTKFVRQYSETCDREFLVSAIESCPRASMQLIHREYLPQPGDSGDERFDFMLELSQPNVLALSATGFTWSDDALSLASRFPVDDEAIKQIQQACATRIRWEQNLVSEMHIRDMTEESILKLDRLHRKRSAQLQIGAVISYIPDE